MFPDDRPRPHYYQFAHLVLRSMLFHDVEIFRGAALAGKADGGLQKLWANIAREGGAGADADLPVTSTLYDCGGRTIVLITPPRAEHIAEAHYIAVIVDRQDPEFVRYVVLEHSWDVTGHPRTVLGEWTAEGHINYGDGPEPGSEAFLAVVCEKFTAK